MAEFNEVMSQFMRLCNSFEDCDNCPVFQEGFSCDSDHQGFSKTGAEELEAIIMQWAAEHPVVYPTWVEWLGRTVVGVDADSIYEAWSVLCATPIPADIAEKLGIEPKE